MPLTRNYKMLTREEELEHFRRWREEKDQASYEALVESQLPWARKMAAKLSRAPVGSLAFEEAEAAAYLGVLGAIGRFDASRGVRLITVVTWGIRSEISHMMNPGAINLPINRYSMKKKLQKQAAKVSRQHQIGVQWSNGVDEFDGLEPAVHVPPSGAMESADDESQLYAALSRIPDRLRHVLRERFFEGRKLQEIADDIGVTRERVRQLESEALVAMKRLIDPTA